MRCMALGHVEEARSLWLEGMSGLTMATFRWLYGLAEHHAGNLVEASRQYYEAVTLNPRQVKGGNDRGLQSNVFVKTLLVAAVALF